MKALFANWQLVLLLMVVTFAEGALAVLGVAQFTDLSVEMWQAALGGGLAALLSLVYNVLIGLKARVQAMLTP